MTNKLFNSALFRSLRRFIYGKNPGNMSGTEKRKVAVETNLRWQDDGGPVVDTRPIDQPVKKDSAGPVEEPGKNPL